MPIKDLCRRHGFDEGCLYLWRSKFGGMSASAFRYARRPDRDGEPREHIVAHAHRRPHFSVRMIHLKLRLGGMLANHRRVLDRLALSRGLPYVGRLDGGEEFCGQFTPRWAYARAVQLRLIQPGSPNQNGYAESFNGRLRGACLNEHWFNHPLRARTTIETWRRSCNDERPKSAPRAPQERPRRAHPKRECRVVGTHYEQPRNQVNPLLTVGAWAVLEPVACRVTDCSPGRPLQGASGVGGLEGWAAARCTIVLTANVGEPPAVSRLPGCLEVRSAAQLGREGRGSSACAGRR
jgi:hypothetical protein